MLEAIQDILARNGISIPTSATIEKPYREQLQDDADRFNQTEGGLTGFDCPKCLNRGYLYFVDDSGICPTLGTRDCGCMIRRRNERRIELSGLKDLMQRYTFDTWETPQKWQVTARELAQRYAAERKGWFLAAGRSGSGKTHLCTAICSELLNAGMSDVQIDTLLEKIS